MIEVKNVSGRTLYPRGATVSALNAAGEVVEEESYSNCAPDMVENGESMFIWDWFYGFETPIDEIAGFAVTVESETSTYTEYQKIDAQGMMMDSVAYALVENTLDTDIYGFRGDRGGRRRGQAAGRMQGQHGQRDGHLPRQHDDPARNRSGLRKRHDA